MKKTIVFILLGLFIFSSVLQAQDQKKILYQNKVIKFTNMKRSGVSLTFGGALLTIGGIALMAEGANQINTNNTYSRLEDNTGLFMVGYLAACVGVGATTGGIVLWSIGGSKAKSYKQKLNSVSFNLNPGPKQVFSLAYRF